MLNGYKEDKIFFHRFSQLITLICSLEQQGLIVNEYHSFSGNPPAEYYYRLWIEELKTIHPDFNYYYFDYCCPDDHLSPEQNLALMQKTLDIQVNSIENNEKNLIISHSFGAYFLRPYYEHLNFECLLIYPFIGVPSLKGKLTLDIAYFTSFFYQFTLIQNFLHKCLSLLMPEVKKVTTEELVKGIKTAKIESEVLRNSHMEINFSKIKNATFIFNLNDIWSPPTTTKLLAQKMKGIEINLEHDFVLFPDQRIKMNQIILDYLQAATE